MQIRTFVNDCWSQGDLLSNILGRIDGDLYWKGSTQVRDSKGIYVCLPERARVLAQDHIPPWMLPSRQLISTYKEHKSRPCWVDLDQRRDPQRGLQNEVLREVGNKLLLREWSLGHG